MDNFKVMYKILRYLEQAMDYSEPDMGAISPEQLRISPERWERLMLMMQDDGYIKGVKVTQSLSDTHKRIAYPIYPTITIKGLEFLEENSLMKKAAALASGVVDVLK